MIKNLKKTQIGIFVIISVILVLGAIFLFSYKSDKINLFTDEKSSYKINEFVKSCLETETKIAVNKIGLHGGWFYTNENMKFANSDNPKQLNERSQGIDYFGIKIPYWYYYDDFNEEFKINIPEYDSENRNSIRGQVKRYIEENLEKDCLNSFKDFENIYDITYEPKEIKVNVIFDDEDIKLEMNLPLRIDEKNSNNSEFIENFKVKTQNKLWIPYHLAKDIVLSENNNSFLEYRILSLIEPYKTYETRDLLPPDYGFSLKYDYNPWNLRKVEKLYKEIVSLNIGYIQFLNTDFKERRLPQGLEDNNFAKALNSINTQDYLTKSSDTINKQPNIFKRYKNYNVKTKYETFFPTSFSIKPSLGDIILLPKTEAFINLIPLFLTEYVASYKVTMPILFEIKNTEYKNDNFVFNLLIETNIDHNSPLKDNIDFNFNLDDIKNEYSGTKTLICDPVQFISKPIKINITDPLVNGKRECDRDNPDYSRLNGYCNIPESGVEDAIVTFDCKGLANCFIGETKLNNINRFNNITELSFRLPVNCNPGILTIEKYGYQKLVFENLDPNFETEIDLGEHIMSSSKKINLSVDLIYSDSFGSGHSIPEGNNRGFLIFENLENRDFVKVIEFTREDQYHLEIDLLPGNYSIQGYLITDDKILIPEETKKFKTGLFGKSKKVKLPEINLDSWIIAGLELKNFEVTVKDLLTKNKLEVHLIDYGVPDSYDTLTKISNTMGNIKDLSISNLPKFTNQ